MSKVISFFKRRHSVQDSFESLVSPHVNVLYKQAYKYLGSDHEAEDLVQEVLVEVYQKQDVLRESPSPAAWLSRCLYHRFIDRYRKKKSQPGTDDIDADHIDVESHLDTPEESYRYRQILKSLDQLSANQRMVITLHDIEGYSLVELSEMMEIPVGTLKSHLHRGRKLLQKEYALQPFDDVARY